jgi:hypothetical protein
MSKYFSRVTVSGNDVNYSYRTNACNLFSVEDANKIFQKTGWMFNSGNSENYTDPNLSLNTFHNRQVQKFTWTVVDPEVRAKFVKGLKYLAVFLASERLIDPLTVDADKLYRETIRKRKEQPLMSIGDRFFRVQLVEEVRQPMRPDAELKQEIKRAIESIKEEYEVKLKQEQDSFDTTKRNLTKDILYPVTYEDMREGWFSYVRHRYPSGVYLAKKIKYSPTHILKDTITYQIKDEAREKYTEDAILVYKRSGLVELVTASNFETLRNPHSSGSYLCTGNVDVKEELSYEDAKILLLRIEEMLKLINMNSAYRSSSLLLGHYISDIIANDCIDTTVIIPENAPESDELIVGVIA